MPLQLDLQNTVASRELHLQYHDEHERLRIMKLHQQAQDVISAVNDYTIELLRTHFINMVSGTPLTLSALCKEIDDGGESERDVARLQLKKMHDALVASLDPTGPVQSFYPITAAEQQQLTVSVTCVCDATEFLSAQGGLFMWMVRRAALLSPPPRPSPPRGSAARSPSRPLLSLARPQALRTRLLRHPTRPLRQAPLIEGLSVPRPFLGPLRAPESLGALPRTAAHDVRLRPLGLAPLGP